MIKMDIPDSSKWKYFPINVKDADCVRRPVLKKLWLFRKMQEIVKVILLPHV